MDKDHIQNTSALARTMKFFELRLKQEIFEIKDIRDVLKKLEQLPSKIQKFKNSNHLAASDLAIIAAIELKIPELIAAGQNRLDKAAMLLKKPTPFQNKNLQTRLTLSPHFNFLDNPFLFKFLTYRDLLNCLRVNTFFNALALSSPIEEQMIFLNQQKTVYLDVNLFTKNHPKFPPLTIQDVITARKRALEKYKYGFWNRIEREETKLSEISFELIKLKATFPSFKNS